MENINALLATLIRRARAYSRLLWVRVMLMGLTAFVAMGTSQMVEAWMPDELAQTVTGKSADRLLQLIASAMLAVTIFSITVMVSVFQSSSAQWTPRVHRLIITDKTTQNTMAVFIGAYVYALLGIILRELGIYGDARAFVLFWMTVVVLVVIVVYLIRWVLHLQGFGQLLNTIRQVETVTQAKFNDRIATPCLGAQPLPETIPQDARALPAWETGYIAQVLPEALNAVAENHDVQLYLTAAIGAYVYAPDTLVYVQGDVDDWDKLSQQIAEAIEISDVRNYEQDPGFGLKVMGEVGSKALSPGINDAGTALDVITRIGRILQTYEDEGTAEPDTLLERLYVPALDAADLVEAGFAGVARDGAGSFEVQECLQLTLGKLVTHSDAVMSDAARDFAAEALARGLATLTFEPDRERLIAAAAPCVRQAQKDAQ